MGSEGNGKSRSKKLWSIVRISLMMMKRTLSQAHLHTIQKRGGAGAGKSLIATCRPNDIHNSFVSPRHIEFSCSNTPAHPASSSSSDLIFTQRGATVVFDATLLTTDIGGRLKNQVDMDAEEFIKRFYMDQRRVAASSLKSSPSPCHHVWG